MIQRTRVLFLIPHLGGGGAEQVTAQLVRHLNPERFEVHLGLITLDRPGAKPPPAWVKVHRLQVKRVRQSWSKLIRLIRSERPDVVLSNMAHLNFLLLLIKPLLPKQIRILVRQNTTASSAATTWLSRLPYCFLYPCADTILCQSEAMARDFENNFAIPRNKLRVLANPIEAIHTCRLQSNSMHPRSPRALLQESSGIPWPRLIAVARLAPEKGIDLLIQAMPAIKRQYPNVRLEILGAGPEQTALRNSARKLKLEGSVDFCGFVENPSDHYAHASLFVLPSRYEGMPNALLEAAAAGLPLVATPCSEGLSDLLEKSPGTWLAASISVESLAQTVLLALSTLSDSSSNPQRFDHAFLAPFRIPAALAAYETLLHNPVPQPPFRIAMLIPTVDQIGGAERQVLLLAKELSSRGHQVTLVALSGRGSSASLELAVAGVEFLSLEMRKAWIDPRGWFRYLSWAYRADPDILHSHLPHATWFARCVRLIAPMRVLIDTIHTSHMGSTARQLLYRLTSPLTNHVTCVSQPVAAAAIQAKIASKRGLTVLSNGVLIPQSPAARTSDSLQARPFQWIAVGRLSPVKDYPTLLRAFAMLPCDSHLRIVGSGPEERSLRRLALELKIDSRVVFTGFQRNVQLLLAESDAFVLSSRWEGLPVSVLEAAAAGLPVIATDGDGTREAMIPGETGLVVPVGDIAALSEAMIAILCMTAQQRRRIGAAGRHFVEERFAISAIADQWESLYSEHLARHPHPSRRG
jgi:glycosyltransferase involved in cell wall biosynthesis